MPGRTSRPSPEADANAGPDVGPDMDDARGELPENMVADGAAHQPAHPAAHPATRATTHPKVPEPLIRRAGPAGTAGGGRFASRGRADETNTFAKHPAVGGFDAGHFVAPEHRPLTRIDAHCHSAASSKPFAGLARVVDCPECFSPPEKVYDQAVARGMDLVTITDHDTIAGALELHERGFERFIIGEEVSVYFPEDRCLLHVLVWGLSPEQHEAIATDNLRDDVYAFAHWLRDEKLAHAFAHPLYIQNRRLTRWHIERAMLLFRGFETRNGAHSDHQNSLIARYLDELTPALVGRLASEHEIEPLYPEPWRKGRTGGSDDHGLLNTGRTWTQINTGAGAKLTDPRAFFERVMRAESDAGGQGGHSVLLAHQIATVASHYFARTMYPERSPTARYVSARLLRFAGVHVKSPSKKRVAAHKLGRRMLLGKSLRKTRGKGGKAMPVTRALRENIVPVLEKYPELKARLNSEQWIDGTALSDHERMADFAEDLISALSGAMGPGMMKAFKKRDADKILRYLTSYGLLQAAQIPYLFSLFYQNKERTFLERFEHETSPPGSGRSVLERPMRVSLFTDTFADINGVSRFIQNIAERSIETGRDLEVITSTRMACPEHPNLVNLPPVYATRMPKYEQLEVVIPPLLKLLRRLDRHQPDVIHISTPGPVGLVGFIAAKMLRIPVLGVYHTDFPAYAEDLFDDQALTEIAKRYMKFFYAPFSAIFTRSAEYVDALEKLGMERSRCLPLLPGFDDAKFTPEHRDPSIWTGYGCRADSVKLVYVGRVSNEKNLPLLVDVWRRVRVLAEARGLDTELVVVGDGPYKNVMAKELKGEDAHFLGFRHGEELSRLYASGDLFVFPSLTDTLGQVVMESQGSGVPALVTDVGGPKEVVVDDVTGYVLDHEDPALWATTITDLLGDPERRARLSAGAVAEMKKYSLSASFEHFWQVHMDAWHDDLRTRGITPETSGMAGGDAADRASPAEAAPAGP